MDAGNFRGRINFASRKDRAKLKAQLQVEQAEQAKRDKQRAEREKQQAERDEQRAEREKKQVKWQMAQVVTSVIGVAAVFAALIGLFISYENLQKQEESLKQQQKAAAKQDQESRYSSISQASLEVEKEIASNPRLLSCFRDKECKAKAKPALNAQELEQAAALASYVVDFYQYAYTELVRLGQAPDSGLFTRRDKKWDPKKVDEGWVSWSETIIDGFRYSRLLCQVLKKDTAAYDWAFVHAVAVTNECQRPKLDPGPSPYQ